MGIPLPFDEAFHVTYVWFDALVNYYSGRGGQARPVARDMERHRQGHPPRAAAARRLLADHAQGLRPAAAEGPARPRLVAAERRQDVQEHRRRRQPRSTLVDEFGVDAFRYLFSSAR